MVRAVGSLFSALLLGAMSATAQTPRVNVDPRVELMSIIFRLAGNREYNQCRVPAYNAAIDRWFEPFKEHDAVQLAHRLQQHDGISYDAVMDMAINVKDIQTLAERVPFDSAASRLDRRWHGVKAREFLAAARRFVADTQFQKFLDSQSELYESTSASLRTLAEKEADFTWFERFFGSRAGSRFIVVPGMANGDGNYGPSMRAEDGVDETYAILGVWPAFDKSQIPTLVHEVVHSYANPLIDKVGSQIEGGGSKLFEAVEEAMRQQAYGNGGTVLRESLVRACTARYVLAHDGDEAARKDIDYERARSFLWTGELYDVLGEYEKDRAKYPTLESFMPRVVAYFNQLSPRVEEMAKALPKVVSTAPANGARDIDPALTRIVVHFDRPMTKNHYSVIRTNGNLWPKLGKVAFDETGTVFTIEVQLEPGHEYEFGLNSEAFQGFKSADGVPLLPVRVRFHTRELSALVSNPSIEVTLREDGALDVFRRPSGIHWKGVPPAARVIVQHVVRQRDGRTLEWEADTGHIKLACRLSLAATEPEFDLSLSAPPDAPLTTNLEYPTAFLAPGAEYRMVLPHQAGLFYSVEDAATNSKYTTPFPIYAGNGLSMPWAGMTDMERGMMMIVETAEGSGITPRVQEGVFAPQVYWQASRDTFDYNRKLHYRLFDSGGYVAMCKYYRNRLIADGRFVSLREKEKARPQLSKLIGAIDLHMRGRDDDQMECVKYLESKGVKRMLINTDGSKETLAWMRERGYLVGSYRLYTDIHLPREGLKEEFTRGYPQDAYTLKDGSPVHGFAYSEANKTTYRCSVRQLQLMRDLIPPLLREKPYEAMFLDVVTAAAPRDCYSAAHPLDRLEDAKTKVGILNYTTGLGLVTGSEDGSDWAAPYLDYFEGMVMTRRFGYIRGVTVNTWPGKFDLDDEYINVNLNEKVRAPLWDLVFHDSVVSTWRWNFTPDRYSDRKWWTKHDLIEMIGGDMPIFMITRHHLDANGERIAQTCKDVSEWSARIGWDELVNHRALTADRSVQESQFSSGWAIVINFSDSQPYSAKQGTIAPWSYKIYRWQ